MRETLVWQCKGGGVTVDERPIRDGAERLTELRAEGIPAEVDELAQAVRGHADQVRRPVEQLHDRALAGKLDELFAGMLRDVQSLGDAAGAAAGTAASELTALLRPALHISSSARSDRPILRDPPADRHIVVDEHAEYTTGVYGRIITARAALDERPSAKRNKRSQTLLRGKVDGDDAGHLIGRVFGGIGYEPNLVPMEAYEVNRGAYRRLERRWERAVRAHKAVDVTVMVTYTDDGTRPAYFEIEHEIDDEIKTLTIMNTPAQRQESGE
ncbi:DNA/RNA non-specific endonuclease [Jiangella alkaliphila]|uniref:DNA/RNA non-specific endonuclease n=1 Tax=Jiangella alkaliphila TaxID=419479 RepID=A0A1H2L808_9ACTN|nr:DNA/RNA non-specific endonuclease [Jiangella alkaliphila]SDU77197.1 DNA/RNA non-specific endonuclease [Jiangella alkaliphila]